MKFLLRRRKETDRLYFEMERVFGVIWAASLYLIVGGLQDGVTFTQQVSVFTACWKWKLF